MKALAKNQYNRYQSAGEMRADIQRALANQPVVAESVMTDAERTQFIARTPLADAGRRAARAYDPEPEEDNHRRAGLIWAAVVVVLLVVIGVGAYFLTRTGGGGAKTVQVAVPPVIGQKPDAAETALRHAGFRPEKGEPTSDKCAGGGDRQAGQRLHDHAGRRRQARQGHRRHLPRVHAADGQRALDRRAQARRRARPGCDQAQLTWHKKKINNVEPFGTVVHQNPQPYLKPVPVGYKVLVEYSSGMIRLPDVVGMTYDEARATAQRAALHERGARNDIITTDASKDNIVAKEDPTPEKVYKPDQQITLTMLRRTSRRRRARRPTPPPPIVTGTPPVTITAEPRRPRRSPRPARRPASRVRAGAARPSGSTTIGAQARLAVVAVGEPDPAAVVAHDVAHDRQAEAGAAGLAGAGFLEPVEPVEHALALVGRDAVARRRRR